MSTAGIIQNNYTYAVSYLEYFFGDQKLSNSSGFFWEHAGDLYLVSNWHCFSGREPDTGRPKSPTLGIPNRVRGTVFFKHEIPGDPLNFLLSCNQFTRALCDENCTSNKWFEHPSHGRAVDVAALKISSASNLGNLHILPANRLNEFDGQVDLIVTQEISIVGYPIGLVDVTPIPVWKRATIATEPLVDLGGQKKFYVDTATRKGMSGSIAIAEFRGNGPYKMANGQMSNTLAWRGCRAVGIYSGRLAPSESEMQLGIVWKRELIDEVIRGGKSPDNM